MKQATSQDIIDAGGLVINRPIHTVAINESGEVLVGQPLSNGEYVRTYQTASRVCNDVLEYVNEEVAAGRQPYIYMNVDTPYWDVFASTPGIRTFSVIPAKQSTSVGV